MMPEVLKTVIKKSPLGMINVMMGKNMCGGEYSEEKSEMPWDMCKKIISSMGESVEIAKFATPEIRGLFEEWAQQVEEEILHYVEKEGKADPDQISKHFKLSIDSAIFFLTRLAKKRKVSFKQQKAEKNSGKSN
jgi:hypothetical protein